MAMELCIDLAVGVTGESARAYVDSLAFRRPFQRSSARPVSAPTGTDVSDVSDVEFETAVRDALPSLTADEASALWLVDVCRVSYAEAADSMRCSTQAIERHVGNGRRRLRDAVAAA